MKFAQSLALLATCAIALVVPASAVRAAQQDPQALLRAAVEAPQRVSFVGEIQMLHIGPEKSEVAIFRIDHLAPDSTRRWYLAPENLYGDSIVMRGSVSYAIDVKRQRVVVTQHDTSQPGDLRGNLHLLLANYRVVTGPDDTIDGHTTHVVMLLNRYTGATMLRLWVDGGTHLILQKEQYASDGSLVEQTRFEYVRYTNAIPAAIFALPASYVSVAGPTRGQPSDNPQRVMAGCGFAARGPHYLPEGFTPVAGDLADVKGVHTLHLLYSDGLRTVSLFENARGAPVDMNGYHPTALAIGSLQGQYVEQGPTTLLAWSQGSLHFALVGDLNRTELEKIAASISQ